MDRSLTNRLAMIASAAGLAIGTGARAQVAPLESRSVEWVTDSGWVMPPPGQPGDAAVKVYQTRVFVAQAPWVRLNFDRAVLPGAIEENRGAFLRISSALDGGVQVLNARSVEEWASTSAYFNGPLVTVELWAYPGTAACRLAMSKVTAGNPLIGGTDSLCGADDRVLSTDPRQSRHLPEGCTTWLFNDTNHMFLTAGHCGVSSGDVQQFNVPLSTATGGLVNPPPEDQYAVDTASVRSNGGQGIGNDYCYFGVNLNSNTGLTPAQRQAGGWYTIATTVAAVAGQTTRITGYGVVSAPVSPTWNQVQKTHSGPRVAPVTGQIATTVSYQTDTTGGNSGSPVYDEVTGTVIGIHTHAGCSSTAGNNGTMITHTGLQTFLSGPLGVCRTGAGTPGGSLYAIGDGANNFGTLNAATGGFARVAAGPPRMEGLAYNPAIGAFYAVSNDTYGVAPGPAGLKLWTLNPASGAATYIANITGVASPINGLGFDAGNNVLYGVVQATGTRVVINTTTGAATIDGIPNAGTTIGAAEFNPSDFMLYGIDDSGGASKLVRFTPATGTVQVIGPLGAGIADCNGLAITDAGEFYTINAATDALLRINPATGAATVVGATAGVFGASFGMSAVTAGASCYANCDGSTMAPVLNVLDFNCFLNRFAAGDTWANCDGSVVPPVLDVLDFNCFLNRFAAGCP